MLGGSYEFFQKTSVAVTLTVLLVALCCVLGYTRAYLSNQPEPESSGQNQQAGENNLNYFLNRIDDGADLFSMETTDLLARNNLDLSNTYGVVLSLKTANYLNGQDIEPYAKDLFDQLSLGSKDMLLVIESSSQAWYLVYGAGLRSYADGNENLVSPAAGVSGRRIFPGGAATTASSPSPRGWRTGARKPFPQGHQLCLGQPLPGPWRQGADSLPVGHSVGRPLHPAGQYLVDHSPAGGAESGGPPPVPGIHPQASPGDLSIPPVFFRPILFWHRAGSAWYQRMLYLVTEAPLKRTTMTSAPTTGGRRSLPGGFQGMPPPVPARTWGRTPPISRGAPGSRGTPRRPSGRSMVITACLATSGGWFMKLCGASN